MLRASELVRPSSGRSVLSRQGGWSFSLRGRSNAPGQCYGSHARLARRTRLNIRSDMFNRDFEKTELQIACARAPHCIRLFLGPRSCGKSLLIAEFRQGRKRVIHLDCRQISTSHPDSFIMAFLEVLLDMLKDEGHLLTQFVSTFEPIFAAMLPTIQLAETTDSGTVKISAAAFSKLFECRKPTDNMNSVFQASLKLLTAWSKDNAKTTPQTWPVLIIDEANALMNWSQEHPAELTELLRFLVLISKQKELCHVILATSEYGFQYWLRQAIGTHFYDYVVMGDLQEQDARAFLNYQLQKRGPDIPTEEVDSAWPRVYEVCGGNPGQLEGLVAGLTLPYNWDEALELLCAPFDHEVSENGLGGDGWTDVQYAAAALKLIDTTVVPRADMAEELGRCIVGTTASNQQARKAGQPALKSLVASNALSLRPWSSWAKDIPVGVYQGQNAVVTATATTALYCMKSRRAEFQRILQGNTASSPGMWLVLPQDEQIADVVKDIKEVEKEIANAKKAGDKEEVVQLRRKEEHLRKTEEQLREQQTILLRQNIDSVAGT